MNNDMNGQNPQGMNSGLQPNMPLNTGNPGNVNPQANPGFVNNVNPQSNPGFVNNVNPQSNPGFVNNNMGNFNNQNQMNYNQQPNFANQGMPGNPAPYQNNGGNAQMNNGLAGNSGKKSNPIVLIVGIVAVALIVGIVLISVLSKPSKSGAKKVLKCTTHHAVMGIVYDDTYEYYINDGSASVKITQLVDLEQSTFTDDIDEWANQKIEAVKADCNSTAGCSFDSKYTKGKTLELIMNMDSSLFGDKLKGLTADQIYENQKSRHVGGQIDGSIYSCQ